MSVESRYAASQRSRVHLINMLKQCIKSLGTMSVESLDMLVHNKIAWAQETTTISNVKSNLKRHIERIS